VADLAEVRNERIYPLTVVDDTQSEVSRVIKRNFETAAVRVKTGVADGFTANPVDLIADNRMHVLASTSHGDEDFHGLKDKAVFCRPSEAFRKVVILCG